MIRIYLIRHKDSGTSYVGQTRYGLARRWRQHCLPTSACAYLRNAIQHYGKDAFEVRELCNVETFEQADAMEGFLIRSLGTQAPNGYNITSGGAYREKRPEAIESMRAKLTGLVRSPESIAKRLKTQEGYKMSEAQKDKLRKYMEGRKRGKYNVVVTKRPKPEHERERIRQMRLAEWAPGGSRRRAA